MKNIFKYAGILFIVSVICAVLITVFYSISIPILEKRDQENTLEALTSIVGDDVEYEIITSNYDLEDYETIIEIYQVVNDGEDVYVYKNSVDGRNGLITYLVSIDNEGNILNISYVSQQETSGIGARITTDEYTSMVIGESTNNFDVDTLSGATISSTAMKKSLEEVAKQFESEVRK